MNSKKSFIVTNPPLTFKLYIFILAFFVILVLAYTIFSPPPHTAMYVCLTILVFIPGTMAALWTKTYRIKVCGIKISVRKCFGLVNFNFDISDIINVKWKITSTRYGEVDNITIFTSKGRKFNIGTTMINVEEMIEFIKENVEANKVYKSYKSFV